MPVIEPGDMATIQAPLDFLGVNCYSRTVVSADPALNQASQLKKDHPERFTDCGWEVLPSTIYDAVMVVKNEFAGSLPIYLTENGACYNDLPGRDGKIHDIRRIDYFPRLPQGTAPGDPGRRRYSRVLRLVPDG